jgi:hypothetical protein
MSWDVVVKLLSMLIIAEGIFFIFKPAILRKVLGFFYSTEAIYTAAAIKVIFGAIFLIAATSCSRPWLVILFGAMLALAGVYAFVAEQTVIRKILDFFTKRGDGVSRLWAVVEIIIGFLLLWAA